MQATITTLNYVLHLVSMLTGEDQSLKIGFLATTATLALIVVGKLLETVLGLVLVAFGYVLRVALIGG